MISRSLVSTTLAAVAALALSACSSGGASTPATVPADVGLEVDAGPGIKFGSTEYTATAGAVKVAYVNHDAQPHSLAIVAADKTTLPGLLRVNANGQVDVGTYNLVPGTYRLLCLIPGHDNMRATLTVK